MYLYICRTTVHVRAMHRRTSVGVRTGSRLEKKRSKTWLAWRWRGSLRLLMSAPPPPQPPDSRTAAPTSPRLLPLPSSQWHVPVIIPSFRPNYVRFSSSTVSSSQILLPPSFPLKKKKNPHPLLLSNSNPHHLASRRSPPPPPLPVDPRGGFDKSRVAVRCGAPSRPVACKVRCCCWWEVTGFCRERGA